MGRKNIVVDIMEKKLSSYGFTYEGYEDLRWTFRRQENERWQEVVVQKSAWAKEYTLEIRTEVKPAALRIPDFVNDNKYTYDWLEYGDKEEQKKVLEELGDIIIKYGLDVLNQNSKGEIEKHYEATIDMHQKLYNEHESMTQKFMEKYELKEVKENAFPILKKELENIFEKEYEEVQDKLVELAAVYGTLIVNTIGWNWRYNMGLKKTYIDNVPLMCCFTIMDDFVEWWEKKNFELLEKEFEILKNSINNWILELKQAKGDIWKKCVDPSYCPLPKYVLEKEEIEKYEQYFKHCK